MRFEEHRGIADHLGQRARVRDGDGATARHRLEGWQPEPLVEAREGERGGSPVERDELVERDAAVRLDALWQAARVVADAGQDKAQLRSVATDLRERLEEPLVVLVLPRTMSVRDV